MAFDGVGGATAGIQVFTAGIMVGGKRHKLVANQAY